MYDCLRTLFASIGIRHCPDCGTAIIPLSAEEITQILSQLSFGTIIKITPFKVNNPSYEYVVSERVSTNGILRNYIKESLEIGKGAIYVTINNEDKLLFQSTQICYHCNRILFELTPSTFSYNNPESMCPVCNGLVLKWKLILI